ncbi:MAG TPA: malate dehydrogenase [Nitrososphaeraceae archaeon]|nr:malate dehydrogenase [Nitrososphaeraceae archaeon]
MKITVIGAGRVGSSVALNCSMRELGDILLLDIVEGLPQGEAMDINHQLAERGIDCTVVGSNNYEDMKGSEFVVIVAGVGRKPGMTRMDLLKTNAEIVNDVCDKIKNYAQNSKIIVVTNPLDPLTYLVIKTLSCKRTRIMGMGGMLDLSRFKEHISAVTGVSRDSIEAMVISEHGENMLPLVRFSSMGGIPLTDFITAEQSQDLTNKTKKIAAEVISLKGATVYAPGNAVSTMVESIIKNKRAILPVSALLEGEYGYSDVCIGVPCVLGSEGIEKIIELKLNEDEMKIFDLGVQSVKNAIKNFSIRPI